MTVGIADPRSPSGTSGYGKQMDGWYHMSLDIAINKFFIYIIELVEAGLAWHLLPVETQIPLEGISVTPCGLLLEGKKH